MIWLFYAFAALFLLVSILPLFRLKHWVFRVWEFGYIQLTFLQIAVLFLGIFAVEEKNVMFYSVSILTLGFVLYHLFLLIPFTPFYKLIQKKNRFPGSRSEQISVIAVNVFQKNESYGKLLKLIAEQDPELLLTIETDQKWQDKLDVLDKAYPYSVKVPLQNTYGMHLYSKLELKNAEVNYYVSDDIPSIRATVVTHDGWEFLFYGIHPPPPSPTEEDTSKERDGEMMSVAKKIRNEGNDYVVVIGDFNNVAWAASSRRFRKISGLIDPRFGRGLVSTFHAKYPFMRIPIDLMFHGERILVKEFKRLNAIDSDHFPLYCTFFVTQRDVEHSTEKADAENLEDMEEDIQEGIKENGERENVY